MPKYFLPPDELLSKTAVLTGDDARHLITVMRVVPGDELTICDGACVDYRCTVSEISKKNFEVAVSVGDASRCDTEPGTRVVLFLSLIKRDLLELAIQKCVELGVSDIVPMISERTVVRLEGERAGKTARYKKISEAAARQSMRGIIPRIWDAQSFCETFSIFETVGGNSLRVAAHEKERKKTIFSVAKGKRFSNAHVWIGPEGGFSDKEISAFAKEGVIPVSLGRRILRSETAGIAALSSVLLLEDPAFA